jgi:hypothetical protein
MGRIMYMDEPARAATEGIPLAPGCWALEATDSSSSHSPKNSYIPMRPST